MIDVNDPAWTEAAAKALDEVDATILCPCQEHAAIRQRLAMLTLQHAVKQGLNTGQVTLSDSIKERG